MNRAVHVVAMGARTPVGFTAEASAAAVRAGIGRLREHPILVNRRGDPAVLSFDGGLPVDLFGPLRMREIALLALREVTDKLPNTLPAMPMDLFLGLPEPRPGLSAGHLATIARYVARRGSTANAPLKAQAFPQGHASVLEALRLATASITDRKAELCIVGGVDTYVDPLAIRWLGRDNRLSDGESRSAFVPGEGAAFLVIASDEARKRYRLPSLALLGGIHSAREICLMKADAINLGQGLTDAIAGAVAGLRLPGETIDDSYGDLNGERFRTEEWGFATLRLQHAIRDVTACRRPSSEWGDVGAASAALFMVLAIQAFRRAYAKGPRALIWASSEGGLRSAAVLQKP